MNFLHADTGRLVTVRDPDSAELNIPVDIQPRFTLGGFFLPVNAIDDLKASWVITWSLITMSEIELIQELEHIPMVTLEDPLGNPNTGYVESIDYSGVEGVVDADSGDPLFQATLSFQLVHLELPGYVPRVAENKLLPVDSPLGISRSGRAPLVVRGNSIHTRKGWFTVLGGEADPWGSWDFPEGDSFDRPVRTLHAANHSIPARWLEVPGNEVPRVRGSVFMGFMPLESGGVITWGSSTVTFDDNFTYG